MMEDTHSSSVHMLDLLRQDLPLEGRTNKALRHLLITGHRNSTMNTEMTMVATTTMTTAMRRSTADSIRTRAMDEDRRHRRTKAMHNKITMDLVRDRTVPEEGGDQCPEVEEDQDRCREVPWATVREAAPIHRVVVVRRQVPVEEASMAAQEEVVQYSMSDQAIQTQPVSCAHRIYTTLTC
jgi:hypothetical protein